MGIFLPYVGHVNTHKKNIMSLSKHLFKSDSNNKDDAILACVIGAAASMMRARVASPPTVRNRMNWDHHVDLLLRENCSKKTYRMTLKKFNELTEIICPHLKLNPKMSTN